MISPFMTSGDNTAAEKEKENKRTFVCDAGLLCLFRTFWTSALFFFKPWWQTETFHVLQNRSVLRAQRHLRRAFCRGGLPCSWGRSG